MIPSRSYAPDWLDDEAAAYLLCLPVSTFREYVAAGILPEGVKIGRHRRWGREALNVALAQIGVPASNGGAGMALRDMAQHGQNKKRQRDAA